MNLKRLRRFAFIGMALAAVQPAPRAGAAESIYQDAGGTADLRVESESGRLTFRIREKAPGQAKSVTLVIPRRNRPPLSMELEAAGFAGASAAEGAHYRGEIPEAQRTGFPLFSQPSMGLQVRIPLPGKRKGKGNGRLIRLAPVKQP